VWTILGCVGGALMTIFLALPPLFCLAWRLSHADRAADVTAIMHSSGLLTLITTISFYIFLWVGDCGDMPDAELGGAFAVFQRLVSATSAHGRVGVLGRPHCSFLTRSGPLPGRTAGVSGHHLLLGVWLVMISVLLIKAINAQSATRYRRLRLRYQRRLVNDAAASSSLEASKPTRLE